MAIFTSTRVDTSKIPAYFSYLPVRMHPNITMIETTIDEAVDYCSTPTSKERKQAIYRHQNPFGNVYAVCHPECENEKLKVFVKVVEMIWIDDDVTEELPHHEALEEHEILRQGLHPSFDDNHEGGKTVGVKKQWLRECRDRMLHLDPRRTPALLEALDDYLQKYDSIDKDFDKMEEYLPYRIANSGYRVCAHFTFWAMNIDITPAERRRIHPFHEALGGVLALTNDYFSWNKERYQTTDRVRNAVRVLMKQFALPQEQARLLLKGIIIDEEEKARRLKIEIEKEPMSDSLRRYVNALELYVGGNCYWSSTCPRYNRPQEEHGF